MHPKQRTALAATAALLTILAACGGDDAGSSGGGDAAHVAVTLTADGCEPHDLTATAGPTTFDVTNDGSAAVTEFEVLLDDKIVGEVENVAAGFERSFTLTLDEGTYGTRCTNGTDEFGTLTVSAGSATATSAAG